MGAGSAGADTVRERATIRMEAKHVFVLVVHDGTEDISWVTDGLRNAFIVHIATNEQHLVDALGVRQYAAVVCCLGGSVEARRYGTLIADIAPDQRVLFAAGPSATDDDLAYLRSARRDWLAHPAQPQEVLALVRAVAG